MPKPLVLVILDGWGESPEVRGNAIANATLPTIEELNKSYPRINLQASGIAVGLPWLQPGNSEVGHQVMGTGQISYQNLPRISQAIGDGTFFQNQVLIQTMEWVKKNNSKLHLLGLASDGGVHSHLDHLFALLELSRWQGINERTFIHAITDGRDTPTHSAESFLTRIQGACGNNIATVCGRYYTMDRNKNWDRIQEGYLALTESRGIQAKDPIKAIQEQYQNNVSDEYLKPIVITNEDGTPKARVEPNDAIIFFNFRPDRARQITDAFTDQNFQGFQRNIIPNLQFTTFTEYQKGLPVAVAFPPQEITQRLSQIFSQQGLRQLKIAETEKYAHVTYFFNGGVEKPYPQEDQILIPSKNAPSYDEVPQMSALEINKALIKDIQDKTHDFILVNYANADMVGHTGNLKAGIKAVETVDACLRKLIPQVLEQGGEMIITADHGNVEEMINLRTGEVNTQHSANPVPCWYLTPTNKNQQVSVPVPDAKPQGIILDIPPTILELMGIEKPSDMKGISLLHLLGKPQNKEETIQTL